MGVTLHDGNELMHVSGSDFKIKGMSLPRFRDYFSQPVIASISLAQNEAS